MATLNASRWGHSWIASQASHSAARDAATGTGAFSNPTTAYSDTIVYKDDTGRGGDTYTIYRTFYYFDTSGISGSVSNLSLKIKGYSNFNTDVIVVKSTAFGGDGSSNLSSGDFGDVVFNTAYSSSYSWTTNNSITLNQTAGTDIQNNDYFIVAVLQHANDYGDVAITGGANLNNGIDYSTTAYLEYTVTAASPTPTPSLTPTPTTSGGGVTYNIDGVLNVDSTEVRDVLASTYSDIYSLNGVEVIYEPGYKYFRFTALDSSSGSTTDKIMITEVELYTGAGQTGTDYPTVALSSNTSQAGTTVSAGHFYTGYEPWEAFDDVTGNVGQAWWTLGISTSTDNWLQIQFDSRVDISSASIWIAESFTDSPVLKIEASNSGSFSGEETVMGYLTGINVGSSITQHDIDFEGAAQQQSPPPAAPESPTPSITITPTQTPTPSITITPTQTPTPSITITPTPSTSTAGGGGGGSGTPTVYLAADFSDQTYTNTTTIPTGWREMTTSDTVWDSQLQTSNAVGRWGFDYNNTGSSGTGPNGGLVGGTGATTGTQSNTNRYMYCETSISQATTAPYAMAVITLPSLDFTNALSNNTLKMTFWFHMYGDNLVSTYGVTQHFGIAATTSQTNASSANEVVTGAGFTSENGGGLDITYWTSDDGSTTNTSNRISGQQQTSATALWRKAEVDLNDLAGQSGVYLHIMLSNIRYFRCDFAVDGISITGEE